MKLRMNKRDRMGDGCTLDKVFDSASVFYTDGEETCIHAGSVTGIKIFGQPRFTAKLEATTIDDILSEVIRSATPDKEWEDWCEDTDREPPSYITEGRDDSGELPIPSYDDPPVLTDKVLRPSDTSELTFITVDTGTG